MTQKGNLQTWHYRPPISISTSYRTGVDIKHATCDGDQLKFWRLHVCIMYINVHIRSSANLAFDGSTRCMHMCNSAFDSADDDQGAQCRPAGGVLVVLGEIAAADGPS